jgi:tetratricopeptide (TPR) repeat protein
VGKRRFVLVFALLYAVGVDSMTAQPLDKAIELYTQSVDGFFDESASAEVLRSRLGESRVVFERHTDACLGSYWMARVDYMLGMVERGQGNEKTAESLFERSLEEAEDSLDCRETSDTHRVVADGYAQLMPYRGVLYAMRYGRRIMEHAGRAVELDPGNARAQLTLALAYLHAPAFAGGSLERSMEILSALERRPDLARVELFSVHVWLAIALDRLEKSELAAEHVARAAAIYPGNSWVQNVIPEEETD